MADHLLVDAGLIRRIAVSVEALRARMSEPCEDCNERAGFCPACQSIYDRVSDVLLDVRLLCVAAR